VAVGTAIVLAFRLGIDAGGVRRGMAQGILGQGQVPGLTQELGGEEMAKGMGCQCEMLRCASTARDVLCLPQGGQIRLSYLRRLGTTLAGFHQATTVKPK